MTSELDQYFNMLGRGPFVDRNLVDPNLVAHELIDIGSGNAGPSGWYGGHAYSASVGQSNLLFDPLMESFIPLWNNGPPPIPSGTTYTPLTPTSPSNVGYYALAGTQHTSAYYTLADKLWFVGENGNPFNTNAVHFYIYPGNENLPSDFFFETHGASVYWQTQPMYDFIVGSLRFANMESGWSWQTYSSATVTLEIVQNPGATSEVVLGTGATYDLKTIIPIAGRTPLVPVEHQVFVAVPSSTITSNTPVALRVHVNLTPNTTIPDTIQLFIGEPQLHFNYVPEPLPFSSGPQSDSTSRVLSMGYNWNLIDSYNLNSNPVFSITPGGVLQWGTGSAITDLYLQRLQTGIAKVMDPSGSGGNVSFQVPASQTLTASSAITATARMVPIQSSGIITLTSAPTIANGADDGLTVRIVNVGANTITLQDQGTLANSNLRLEASTIALAPRNSVELMWSLTVGDWLQVGKVCAVL